MDKNQEAIKELLSQLQEVEQDFIAQVERIRKQQKKLIQQYRNELEELEVQVMKTRVQAKDYE